MESCRCIVHKDCGGLVAPNTGNIDPQELLNMFKDVEPACMKCGKIVPYDQLEIESP